MRAQERPVREWTERDDALLDAILAVRRLCRCTDPVPMEARCPAAETGRCGETSPVYVLV